MEEGTELPVVRGVMAGGTAATVHVSMAVHGAPDLPEYCCSNHDTLYI